ncbi:MAG TPA: hypothetical protein VI757_00880 [Bacteroidia bacterium]|nr:hypothetical protein [Bacteroidia bacterium]
MAKQDYFPKKIDAKDTWFATWLANIAAVLAALLLPLTHADAVKLKINDCRTKFTDWKNTKALALSKSSIFKAALKDTLLSLRPYNQNLKTTTGYSEALGNTIGIEGAESTFDPTTAKPEAEAIYEGGQVTIEFTKPQEVKQVSIKSKRGAETVFTDLATDTNSPYNDNRDNLDITKPENREYILQYMNKDNQLIGQVSDTIKVTVP